MSQLGATLRAHARERGEAPAVYAGDRWWTYDELVDASDRLGAHLEVGPGDVVAIAIDRGIESVLAVCGTVLAGAIPAVLDPRDAALAGRTLRALRPAAVLAGPGDAALPGATVLALDDALAEPPRKPMLPWSKLTRPDSISHIIFTSGSTSTAKGVVWSELRAGYDWLVNPPAPLHRQGPSGIVVPLCTALGLQELLRSLHHGLSVALLEPPFLGALAQAAAVGVNRWKLTPTHVEMWLAMTGAPALPALRAMQIATAPITPERIEALQQRAPNARIARSYGLTESGAATMVWRDRHPRRMHTVGRPIAFRRVTVRGRGAKVMEPGEWGEVVIEMPMWAPVDGYLDAPPELAKRFRNGVLWTGDRGTMDRHGFLRLGPRLAEILKVGGRSVSAPRIEEGLVARHGFAQVVVVGVPDAVLGEVPCAMFVPTAADEARAGVEDVAATRTLPAPLPVMIEVEAGEVTGPTSGGASVDFAANRVEEPSDGHERDTARSGRGGVTEDGVQFGEWGRTPADELPRWFLARRELPRTPSGKHRRGVLQREAIAWTKQFPTHVAAGPRVVPAYDVDARLAVVDGPPVQWTGEPAHDPGGARPVDEAAQVGMSLFGAIDPGARAIALVARQPARPLAYAILQAGASPVEDGASVADSVRFIIGPLIVEDAVALVTVHVLAQFATDLMQLAKALPGSPALVTYALPPTHTAEIFASAGFAPAPERDGWWRRRETTADSASGASGITVASQFAVPGTALDTIGLGARVLERWIRRRFR